MWHNETNMTLMQVAIVFNVLGLAVPMLVSLAVVVFHRAAYFRYWTLSYVFIFSALFLNLFYETWSRPMALATAIAASHVAGTALLFMTSSTLFATKVSTRYVTAAFGLVFICAQAFLWRGSALEAAILPTLLLNLLGHLLLGGALVSLREASRLRFGLAALSVAIGLWGLTYPILADSPIQWMGYIVVGTLHLGLGLGMAMFVLEQNARTLEAHNRELKALDQLKNNFISTISHEVRTPLTVISAASSIWEREDIVPREELARTITAQVQVLDRLLSDILDFARLESRQLTFMVEEGDLGEVAFRAGDGFVHVFEEMGITFEQKIQEEPVWARFDWERMLQVLTNLLTNAGKFTPRGGRVVLEARLVGVRPFISVTNIGTGIAANELDAIFQKFYQVDGNSTRRHGGVGLGLAICKSIVEEGHQGRIWAESDAVTTTFKIELPPVDNVAFGDGTTQSGKL